MLSLRAIQTHFTPCCYHGSLPERQFFKQRRIVVVLCKSDGSDQGTPPPEGDKRKQELLARIAMLQAQKVRLTDYLDERSAYLTKFAEEASAEIDQIGENALKELDEAGTRIMENIESRMQAFEESAEQNKQEIEKNEKNVVDFENQIEKDRNEWLFFKNLRDRESVDKVKAAEEAEKIRELNKKSAGSVVRRNVYIALIALVVIGIVDASVSSAAEWGKVAILGVILVGLVSQLVYEQSMLSETEKTKENSKE